MRPENSRLPAEIQFATRKGTISANKVGPSLRGYVFRCSEAGLYFRLIPIDDIPTLTQRRAVADRVSLPRQSKIAPVVDAGDTRISGDLYYYVSYEMPNTRTLSDLLEDPDNGSRLALISRVVSALPEWWQKIAEGILPMPADIVFAEYQWPTLLALPPDTGWWPRIETLIAEPERIWFIAPEMVRGSLLKFNYRAVDVYACAVMAFRCFFSHDPGQRAEVLLRKAASGTLFELKKQTARIPSWFQALAPFQTTCQSILTGLSLDPRERANVSLSGLAAGLSTLTLYTDSLKAADAYHAEGRNEEAVALLQEASLTDERPELCLVAALIAHEHLCDPVRAIEFYERAVSRGAGQQAFRGQLRVLVESIDTTQALRQGGAEIRERLDGMVLRDFGALPRHEQSQIVLDVANYLMIAANYLQARQVLYPHLYEGRTHLWWEFDRNLLYAEALIKEGETREASLFLGGINSRLSEVGRYQAGDPRRLADDVFGRYVQKLAHLNQQLKENLHERGGQNSEN
jgi:tetratricopeptide (TPR) repeat protein